MSQKLKNLKEKLRRAIREELVEYDNLNTQSEEEQDELEEASMTGNLDGGEGPPKTPYAFQSKKKRAQDKKKEDEISTNSTGFIKMNEVVKKEVNAVKKVLDNLKKLRQNYIKIYNIGDKTLKSRQFNKYYETILNAEKEITTLHRTLDAHQRSTAMLDNVNEGRYHTWRNDESLTAKQKIGKSMREVRDSLNGLSKTIDMSVKLKNELNVNSSDYWKTTHKALGKISERLVKLANKVGKLQ